MGGENDNARSANSTEELKPPARQDHRSQARYHAHLCSTAESKRKSTEHIGTGLRELDYRPDQPAPPARTTVSRLARTPRTLRMMEARLLEWCTSPASANPQKGSLRSKGS